MIYISTPAEKTHPERAKENIRLVIDRLREIGVLVINPMKLGMPETWTTLQKIDKRKEILSSQATAIFLQVDWKDSEMARSEFAAVYSINSTRKASRHIQIYFEESFGFNDLESDIREGFLKTRIPEASYK